MKSLAVFCLALSVALEACGGSTPVPATSAPVAPGARITTVRPTALAPAATNAPVVSDGSDPTSSATSAAADSSGPIGMETIDCGALTVSGNPPRSSDSDAVRAAAACFLKAVTACQPATLTVNVTDLHVLRQFTVAGSSGCVIREALQADPNSPPATVDCAGAAAQNGGILIKGCSHLGDFGVTP